MKRLQGTRTNIEQQNRLELPEQLDSIGLKLTEAVYIEPRQKYSTMGQMRLSDWIYKKKNKHVAHTTVKTKMEFIHRRRGIETVTRMLRTTIQLGPRHLAVDIYLIEGNSNLVLGRECLRNAELRFDRKVLSGSDGEKDERLQKDQKGTYIILREAQIIYELNEAAEQGKKPQTTLAHLHKYFGHPSAESLYRLIKYSSMKSTTAEIQKIVDDCTVCMKKRTKQPRKKVGFHKATAFNQVVSMDLKVHANCYILWMVDEARRFIRRQVLQNKRPETIIAAMSKLWINGDGAGPGMPEKHFYTDNRREFVNETMLDLLDTYDITLRTTAAYTAKPKRLERVEPRAGRHSHGITDGR